MRSPVTTEQVQDQTSESVRRPMHLMLVESGHAGVARACSPAAPPTVPETPVDPAVALRAAIGRDAAVVEAARRVSGVLRHPVTRSGLVTAMEDTLEGLRESVGAIATVLLAYDEQESNLSYTLCAGDGDAVGTPDSRIPLRGTVSGWVFEHRTGLVVNNVPQDPRFCDPVERTAATRAQRVVAVPLFVDGACLGVIELREKHGRELFSLADLHRAEFAARYISMAAERLTGADR